MSIVHVLDLPLAAALLGTGMFLSGMLGFPQFRKIFEFIKILQLKKSQESTQNTLSPLHALYTAMSTSLGMGNIISPAVAIAIGGPGALFWMMIYAVFGSVTKFVEVFFAVRYKRYAQDGSIIGGPTGYLYTIHPFLAHWYGALSIILFSSWSALQSKTLAVTYKHVGIDEYMTGLVLSCFVFGMLVSGTKTIGKFASRIVPMLFMFYLAISLVILCTHLYELKQSLMLIMQSAFLPAAPLGGFAGALVVVAFRQGIFKGAFTTEAGVGTAAIPHGYAQTDNALQQGILGMYSIFMNTFLCMISGLVALVTGVWTRGFASNDLALLAFKSALPTFGAFALTATVTMCIIGATLGNSFNGSKCFGSLTNNRWMKTYYIFVSAIIFIGSIAETATLWEVADIILPLIAFPNLIGILILAIKHRKELMA